MPLILHIIFLQWLCKLPVFATVYFSLQICTKIHACQVYDFSWGGEGIIETKTVPVTAMVEIDIKPYIFLEPNSCLYPFFFSAPKKKEGYRWRACHFQWAADNLGEITNCRNICSFSLGRIKEIKSVKMKKISPAVRPL